MQTYIYMTEVNEKVRLCHIKAERDNTQKPPAGKKLAPKCAEKQLPGTDWRTSDNWDWPNSSCHETVANSPSRGSARLYGDIRDTDFDQSRPSNRRFSSVADIPRGSATSYP